MQVARRLAARLAFALPLAVLACSPVRAGTEATAAAGDTPAKVIVGAYINDIQELDFKTNNYVIDLYVWFRWNGADANPSKTMEFMNRFASDDNRRDELYDEPQIMPDGSRYDIIRYQGRFSTKFPLEKYPFDTQYLTVTMEDTLAGAGAQIYVPDAEGGVTINPNITLPGFKVGKPEMRVVSKPYPTNFGDLSEPEATDYSRVTLSIPVSRPVVAMAIKTSCRSCSSSSAPRSCSSCARAMSRHASVLASPPSSPWWRSRSPRARACQMSII
jgi:hypothetical protein